MIASTLKKERMNRNMTLAELSKASGVPKSTISELENNVHSTSFMKLFKIVRALASK